MRGPGCLLLGLTLLIPGLATAGADEIIGHSADADVVIVGEIHDNPQHQETQAAVAAALSPRAIVFEMLSPDQAALVKRHRARGADAAEVAAALDWDASGWPPFERYYQVALAAPRAALRGAQAPRRQVERAMAVNAAEAFGALAGRYGLDTPLPPAEQSAREARQAAAHCNALPSEMLPGMVEAQRLRDAWLARAVVDGLTVPGSGPVLVITGNGHAHRDWGVPAVLEVVRPRLKVVAHGQFEGPTDGPYDSLSITTAPDRPDPCEAFKQRA